MKFANGTFAVFLILTSAGAGIQAQNAPAAVQPKADSIQTFYLANVTQSDDGREIVNAIRTILPSQASVYLDSSQDVLIVRSSPEQLAIAQKIVSDLDRPKKAYRLTYTISEMDGGKRVSMQHFAMIVADGQRMTLKQGSKVPVSTGPPIASGSGMQTQFTYIDVGINFDATLTSVAGGGILKTKVDRSSVAEENPGADVGHQPVIRQATLEGTLVLTMGKPLVLGSLDIPSSTAHLDIEAMMELVK